MPQAGPEQQQDPDNHGRDDKGGVEDVHPNLGHLDKDLCATDEAVLLAEARDRSLMVAPILRVGVDINPPDQGLGREREHIVTHIAKLIQDDFTRVLRTFTVITSPDFSLKSLYLMSSSWNLFS